MKIQILTDVQNPLVLNTLKNRFNEWVCRKYGCITRGSYYGMQQATCRRCGHKNACANDYVPEWSKPF